MLTFIFLLIFQGFSGGVSGYITNKYAVNMLFKEYTPLKLGGVIKKKKEKFIEEISTLVERDIINANTLKSEISNKNFNIYIEQIAETFFGKELKKVLGNTKICEVDDFSNSALKSEEFIRKNLNIILPDLLDNFIGKIKLQDILNENQISEIVNSGYDLLVKELEETSTLNEVISNIYNENSDISLADIFSENVQKRLINNISKSIKKIINYDILADEKSCEIFLDNICSAINIDLTLIKLQGLIGDYEINQFITASEEKEFTLKLFSKLNDFISSEKGRELLLSLISEIISSGKDIDLTIYEILPDEMEKSLTSFIKTVISKIMPYISEWILSNKSSFDEMIESAIDEAIQGIDENIKKLIISKVRSALMGDISSKNNIVNKIINYINSSLDDDSYSKLADLAIDYLKNKKIKDIIEVLEKQNLISVEELVDVVVNQFALRGESILKTIIKSQFSKKIYKIIKIDLVKLFHNKFKPILYRNIFNNKEKLGEKLNNLIEKFINLKGNELFNKNLSQLFTYNYVSNFSNKFAKLTSKLLRNNKATYSEKLRELIASKVRDINLACALENYKVDISSFIVDNSMVLYKEAVDKYKKYEIIEIIKTYFDKNQLADILKSKGYPMLISKLPNLLNGNIKRFAKNNLSKYDEDEICDIVQDFMGNQLKPLSVFGAVLGTIVGVIYQLILPNSIGRYGFPSDVLNGIMSFIVMAFIGYITNVIALWMIFHPYKENKIVAKIPFFKKFALGYIPAHKDQFAMGMAKLIDEELLNKEEINKSFNLHKNNIQSVLMKLVTNNNYQILINFIRNKKKNLTKYIYEKILKYCDGNSNLSKRISSKIGESKFNKYIKKDHVLNLVPNLTYVISNTQNYLVKLAQDKLSSTYKFNDILPNELCAEIEEYIQSQSSKSIQEKINNVKEIDFIKLAIDNYANYYDLGIKKLIKEILDKDSLEKLEKHVEEKAYTYIFNDFKIHLSDLIKQFLHNEFNENNDIGSMFNGKIKRVINENLYLLTNYSTNKLIDYLKENEYIIAINVQETIKNELNFFEKIAYSTFGGDDIAYNAVSIVLNKKLPIMLKDETNNLISVAKAALDESIYTMKASTLNVKADEINIAMLIDNTFEQLSKSINSKTHIYNGSNLILDLVISTPLIEYLELCNLRSLNLVYKKFNNEINIMKEYIYNNIDINKNALSKTIGEFLDEKIIKTLFNSCSSEIFETITHEEIEEIIKKILNIIGSSEETKKYLYAFLESFYDNALSELKIDQIINENLLSKDIESITKHIFNNSEFNEKNIILIESVVQSAIDTNFDFISDNTKNYLLSKTIKMGLNSSSNYIVPVLQEIDLKNISNKQIELLNPKEIDILFNSFAGDFFNKLRIYGVFGFVFGINVGLSFILWAIDWKYSKDYSQKDSKPLKEL